MLGKVEEGEGREEEGEEKFNYRKSEVVYMSILTSCLLQCFQSGIDF